MEEDLMKYRKKKKMLNYYQRIKQTATGWFKRAEKKQPPSNEETTIPKQIPAEPPKPIPKLTPVIDETDIVEQEIPTQPEDPTSKLIKCVLWALSFLLWSVCYAIAIELEFGIVFLIVSALLGIYYSTNTRPKAKDEPSAYSVFNPNFENLNGTFTADMFEQSIGAKYMKT